MVFAASCTRYDDDDDDDDDDDENDKEEEEEEEERFVGSNLLLPWHVYFAQSVPAHIVLQDGKIQTLDLLLIKSQFVLLLAPDSLIPQLFCFSVDPK